MKQNNKTIDNPLLHFLPTKQKSWLYAILFLLTFVFYGNSINNEYALDDGLVIGENSFTLKGIKGIPDILLHDSFYPFYSKNNTKGELQGGRWRPLSIISFAIEKSMFGLNPKISHFFNVLCYAILICTLFYFLSQFLLPQATFLAFLVSLLFLIHPIHTESIANIKSRDELFSLLFLLLYLIQLFLWIGKNHRKHLIWSVVFLSLALLSKENGVTFLLITPLFIFYFTPLTYKEILKYSMPSFITIFIFLFCRYLIVGTGREDVITEVMNNPYLMATFVQKWTSIFTLPLRYLMLLIFPHPLSYDYSYAQLPYESLTSPLFWLSIVIHIILLIVALKLFFRKHIVSFCILFYMLSYSIISNIIIDLGATMGERLIFQASLGFCMLIAWALYQAILHFNISKKITQIALLLLIVVCGIKTIARNNDWANNETLFIKDVKSSPNSAKTTNAAGTAFIGLYDKTKDAKEKDFYLKEAMKCFEKCKVIHPKYADVYMNMGSAVWRLQKYDEAENFWNEGRELSPNHIKLKEYDGVMAQRYMVEGINLGKEKKYNEALEKLRKGLKYSPNDAELWYNIGGISFNALMYDEAQQAMSKCLELNPNHESAKQALAALKTMGLIK